jgi:hypothetical protein
MGIYPLFVSFHQPRWNEKHTAITHTKLSETTGKRKALLPSLLAVRVPDLSEWRRGIFASPRLGGEGYYSIFSGLVRRTVSRTPSPVISGVAGHDAGLFGDLHQPRRQRFGPARTPVSLENTSRLPYL